MHLLFIVREIDNEPHGILLIAALLKQHGHRVSLVVATEEDPIEAAVRLRPDVVGYTVYTGTQRYYLDLNRQIKSRIPVFSIFGGPHPTFFPEMIEEEGVDGLCVGEGEYATLELMDALEASAPFHGLRNWLFKTDSGVIRNPLRPLLTSEELDQLPFADRELLYAAHPPSRENRIRPFITGRGCPYNCSFCFNRAYSELYEGQGHSAPLRRRSVNSVVREVKQVASRHELAFITFMDDTFIVQRRWLEEFSRVYPAQVGLPFWCQVRANLVDESVTAALKRAGCVSVSFGIEAGNDRLRNQILNRNMSREQIIRAAETLRAHGIAFSTNNMLGLPTGGLAEDLETLALNVQCRPAYANVFLYQPYPKTELGEMALQEGYMHGTFDDLSGSVTLSTPIRFQDENEGHQVENLQKLFALTVEFPALLPLVRRLIRLPPNPLFWLVYKAWKGYAMKRRMFPYHLSPGEYLATALQYMRIRSQ
ncbi:MAG: B12-binding domain-containing radical SAM protein [Anaerolineae bacterium]|nr:B12-binding domain-containing radical SAM protein [Anaerolineae bacterium]